MMAGGEGASTRGTIRVLTQVLHHFGAARQAQGKVRQRRRRELDPVVLFGTGEIDDDVVALEIGDGDNA